MQNIATIGQGTFVPAQTLADFFAVTKQTIYKWEASGIIPPAIRISSNCARFDFDACVRAVREREAGAAS